MKKVLPSFICMILLLSSCVKQIQSDIAVGSYYGPYYYGASMHGPGVSYVTRVNDNMVNITVDIPGILNNIYFSNVLIQDLVSAGHIVTATNATDTLNGSFGSSQFVWHAMHNDTMLTFSGSK